VRSAAGQLNFEDKANVSRMTCGIVEYDTITVLDKRCWLTFTNQTKYLSITDTGNYNKTYLLPIKSCTIEQPHVPLRTRTEHCGSIFTH
jgi:hypothetical protein